MTFLLGLALGLLLMAATAFAWKRSKATHDVPRLRATSVGAAAYLLGWLCHFAEFGLWQWTGLSLVASPGRQWEALLALFLFAAPLEEGAKVLCIWPLYSGRRLLVARHGLVLAALAGASFAAGEAGALILLNGAGALWIARVLLSTLAHVVCSALWGTTLSAHAKAGAFAAAWTAATLLRGLFDHIVFGRGPGLLVLTAPLFLTMLAVTYAVARRAAARDAALAALWSDPPGARHSATGWAEPASIQQVWQALQPKRQPLMLHWMALGTLVTAGLALCALALGLYAGHAMGLDFAAADEDDVRSNGPLLFLATVVGAAFPVAGYLVARASGTRSVLEPALGAALAVIGAVLFLSMTTPIAAVFVLALVPIAFALASGGAWFGTSR